MEKIDIKKMMRNFLFFIALIALTLWVILKDQNITEIIQIIQNVKIEFVILGIFAMAMFIILDAVNLRRNVNALGGKTKLLKNIKYSLIGFFFSGITPAATGGQPMQIYYMYKEGIPVSISTATHVLNLVTTQVVTILLGIVSMFLNLKYMTGPLIALFILGIALNMSALTLLIIGLWSRRLSNWLVNFAVKVMKFFRIKSYEKKQEKFQNELKEYQESSKFIRQKKSIIIRSLITTTAQYLFYYSIAYFTYRALGLSEHTIFELVSMQALVYATVSGIPSPGSVGVSEGAFIQIFKNVYPSNLINSATLLNRGVNFYLYIIISGIVVIINAFMKKDKKIFEKLKVLDKQKITEDENMLDNNKLIEEEKNDN